MVVKLCILKLEEYKALAHFHGTLMIVFCVFNLTFSVVATLGNLLVIRALWKSSTISATLKYLFLSLAVSDLAVALHGSSVGPWCEHRGNFTDGSE